jgi:hypothetical protein
LGDKTQPHKVELEAVEFDPQETNVRSGFGQSLLDLGEFPADTTPGQTADRKPIDRSARDD